MKFNKIITVLLLSGVCLANTHTVTTKAQMANVNAVISNELTPEVTAIDDVAVDVLSGAAVEATVSGSAIGANENVMTNDIGAISTDDAEEAGNAIDSSVNEADTAKNESSETTEKKKTSKKKKKKKNYTANELKLMSCIIYCEANGEPYAGKLAVGIVVMNRKSSKSFPNTIKGVVYQKYQFGPVRNGSLKKALKRYEAGKFTSATDKACIRAAKAALNKKKKVTYKSKTHNMKDYYFFSARVKNARLTIKHHQFK